MDDKKKIAKWGFGMAPISTRMQNRYDNAVQTGFDILDGNLSLEEIDLAHLSDLKGMFNRCLRQDQWDWFSVFTCFGEPRHEDLKFLGYQIGLLRNAIKLRDEASIELSKISFINKNGLSCLLAWQNGVEHLGSTDDCGWVYILSTREQAGILKIGMTTRSVALRVKEINSATGILIPYACRKVFRVKNAALTERELFQILSNYRLRPDREFFEIPFGNAVGIIERYLEANRMLDRKRGIIHWFSPQLQYGFIQYCDTENIFFHVSELEYSDVQSIRPGIEIEFDIGDRLQGRYALQVRIVKNNLEMAGKV